MKLMHTGNEIIGALETNRNKIKTFGVKKIGMFGSFVRGDEGPNSDIDILVEFESGKKNFDNYMDLKLYLEGMFGRKVDLVIKDAIKPSLRLAILNGVKYAA